MPIWKSYFGGLHGKLAERRPSFQLTRQISSCSTMRQFQLTLSLRVFTDGNSKDTRDLELGARVVVNLTNNARGKVIGIASAVLLSTRVPRIDRPNRLAYGYVL